MTLRELVQKSSHAAMFDCIRKHYYLDKSEEELIELTLAYRHVGDELSSLPNNLNPEHKIYITEKVVEEIDGRMKYNRKFIDVCLYDKKNDELYAIDLVSWGDIIDMEIYKAVEMDDHTALAHILWEITFWGWNNKEMVRQAEKTKESKEYKNREKFSIEI
jgi:hypothetical protein